jgi:hypothetical protein
VEVEYQLAVQVVVGACPGFGCLAAAYPNVRQLNGTMTSPSTTAEARNRSGCDNAGRPYSKSCPRGVVKFSAILNDVNAKAVLGAGFSPI